MSAFGPDMVSGLWRPQFWSPTWLNNFPFPSLWPLPVIQCYYQKSLPDLPVEIERRCFESISGGGV